MTASVYLGGDLGLWLELMDHDKYMMMMSLTSVKRKSEILHAANKIIEYSNPNRLTCAHQKYQNVTKRK